MIKKIVRQSLKTAGASVLSLALLFSSVLVAPQSAYAQTTGAQSISTLFSQIEAALRGVATSTQDMTAISTAFAQLTQLYNQYLSNLGASVGTGGSGTAGTGASATAVSNTSLCGYLNGISKTLHEGDSDVQVTSLQRLLNGLAAQSGSYQPVAYTGAGSRGLESSFFGSGTRASLIRWQQANLGSESASSYGVFDATTRARMNQIYCGGSSSVATGTSGTSGSSTGGSTSAVFNNAPVINSLVGPVRTNDGRISWAVTWPTGTSPHVSAAKLRIGTASASSCANISSHIVRDSVAYLPRTDISSNSASIKTVFSYDPVVLGENTTYYYCVTLVRSNGDIITSSDVGSFKAADLLYTTATVNPPSVSVSPASVQSSEKVTIYYDTNGLSGCYLRGGGFNTPVSNSGSRTWTADATTTFKVECTHGWATASVSVNGVAGAPSSSSGSQTITVPVTSTTPKLSITTATESVKVGIGAVISGTSENVSNVEVIMAGSGKNGTFTCNKTPATNTTGSFKGYWSCVRAFIEAGKAEVSVWHTGTDGIRRLGGYRTITITP